MKKLLKIITFWVPGKGKKTTALSIPGFLSWSDFNHRILQERSRTDRFNSPFTMVSFSFHPPESGEENYNRLLEILASVMRDRTRKSDIKGLHGKENKKLGMILPHTDFEKASVVIHAVETQFREALEALKFDPYQIPELAADVFIYPMDKKKTETVAPAAAPGGSQPETAPSGSPASPSTQEVA